MILDKAKMAHDWVMKYGKVDSNYNRENTVQLAWDYADAMQAEEDKRKPIPKLPALQQTFINGVEQPRYAPTCEEWQPDWSQAPDAKYWAIDSSGFADWFSDKPELDEQSFVGDRLRSALQYGYTGDWQDSLRKRP